MFWLALAPPVVAFIDASLVAVYCRVALERGASAADLKRLPSAPSGEISRVRQKSGPCICRFCGPGLTWAVRWKLPPGSHQQGLYVVVVRPFLPLHERGHDATGAGRDCKPRGGPPRHGDPAPRH